MHNQEKYLIVVAGPTAVGKTALAIDLAEHLHTVVVSADSRQIYREMTIGTAKPSAQELARVQHYFIDSQSIQTKYDAAQYAADAHACLATLFMHHQYVVVCGGSGLYIKALIEGFDDIPDVPHDYRRQIEEQYALNGLSWLQQQLLELDPEYFEQIDQHNTHRLMRGLEVRLATGQSILSFRQGKKQQLPFHVVRIGLEMERDELYQRINERMDRMIEQGLFKEAASLYSFKHLNALQTVGYSEIFAWMEGAYDRDEAIRLLKRNTRRYAKRQLTWFKRDKEMKWFAPGQLQDIIHYINLITK